MTTAAATTELPDAPAYQMSGVEIFASGRYRNKPWNAADVREMAANARKLGPSGLKLFVPPIAAGHGESQEWLGEETGQPAGGYVDPDSVRAVPDPNHPGEMILTGTVVNIPKVVADKIASGEYSRCSAELYDSFLDDFQNDHGKVLRRVAILGAEPSQVKRTQRLPMPVPMPALKKFAERAGVLIRSHAVRQPDGAIHTHAEATATMDRNQTIAAIQAAMPGLSKATLDAMPDDALKDLLANCPTPAAAAPAAAPVAAMADGDPAAATPAAGDTAAAGDRDEMVAELVDAGVLTAEEAAGMSDEELGAMLDELDAADAGQPATADMADGDPADRDAMIAELSGMGQDPAMLAALSDADLAALYAQVQGAATPATPTPAATMGEPKKACYSEPARRPAAPQQYQPQADPLVRRIHQQHERIARMNERTERRLARAEREFRLRDCQQFCERLVAEGRIYRGQIETVYKPLLLSLDNTHAVHKFTEAGRTHKLTAYEAKKRQLAAGPAVIHFNERLPGGAGPQTSDEAEAAKVRRWANALPDAALKAGQYGEGDLGRANFVSKFSETRKKDPTLTASKYLGVRDDDLA